MVVTVTNFAALNVVVVALSGVMIALHLHSPPMCGRPARAT